MLNPKYIIVQDLFLSEKSYIVVELWFNCKGVKDPVAGGISEAN